MTGPIRRLLTCKRGGNRITALDVGATKRHLRDAKPESRDSPSRHPGVW
jgi:hypothetical protein